MSDTSVVDIRVETDFIPLNEVRVQKYEAVTPTEVDSDAVAFTQILHWGV